MKRLLTALLLSALPPAAAAQDVQPAGREAYTVLTGLFAYDASLPLNARAFERFDTATFTREKIVFDGWRGSRVPGLVALPKNAASKHPVILLIDGIGGWKERWWQRTSWNRGRVLIDSLVAAGYGVAMIDAPASGERTYENDYETAETFVRKLPQWRDMALQNTIELRRLIDYLATRPDVDVSRIGALGLSHGGMVTFYLAAIESRVRVAVAGLTPQQNIPAVLLPLHYAPHVAVPFLLLAGTKDGWYTPEQVQKVSGLMASQHKQVVWYDVGHRLPEEYAGATVAWFREYLR
ncbi:MAG TPA: dienelactone hydrolase family protein [Longimicrobiales bacterium]